MSSKINSFLKLTLVGDAAIGKTCLILEYIYGDFVEEYVPTKADAYRKKINLLGDEVTIDILDTAGQEDYQAIRDGYLKHGDGFLLVFDLTNRETFESLKTHRNNVLRVKDDDNVPIILVGNKSDLTSNRQISFEEASALAEKWGIPYIETSAKMRSNVDKAFYEIFIKIKDLKLREIEFVARGGGAGKSKPKSTLTKEEEDAVRADSMKKRIKKFYQNLKSKCELM